MSRPFSREVEICTTQKGNEDFVSAQEAPPDAPAGEDGVNRGGRTNEVVAPEEPLKSVVCWEGPTTRREGLGMKWVGLRAPRRTRDNGKGLE